MINKIKYVLKNPLNISKSIYYSIKFSSINSSIKFYKFPILCTINTKIKMSKNSKINIGRRLNIGMRDTQISRSANLSKVAPVINIGENGIFNINGQVTLYGGTQIIIGDTSNLTIGNNTYISFDSLVICKESISIGDDCAISWNVNIIDSDFHNIAYNDEDHRKEIPIIIGDRVWIGSKASILKGVKIGNDVVIGAGSIVTKDIPSGCVVAGNPAKIIKKGINWF